MTFAVSHTKENKLNGELDDVSFPPGLVTKCKVS